MSTSIIIAIVAVVFLVVCVPIVLLVLGAVAFWPKAKKALPVSTLQPSIVPLAHEQERDEIASVVLKDFYKKWDDERTVELGAKFNKIYNKQ